MVRYVILCFFKYLSLCLLSLLVVQQFYFTFFSKKYDTFLKFFKDGYRKKRDKRQRDKHNKLKYLKILKYN